MQTADIDRAQSAPAPTDATEPAALSPGACVQFELEGVLLGASARVAADPRQAAAIMAEAHAAIRRIAAEHDVSLTAAREHLRLTGEALRGARRA